MQTQVSNNPGNSKFLQKVEISPGVAPDASQHHHRSLEPSVSFGNDFILLGTSKLSSTCHLCKVEPGHVGKNNSMQLGSGQSCEAIQVSQDSISSVMGQNRTYIMIFGQYSRFTYLSQCLLTGESMFYYLITSSMCMFALGNQDSYRGRLKFVLKAGEPEVPVKKEKKHEKVIALPENFQKSFKKVTHHF